MDIQQATLLETLTLYADKTQQQQDIDVTDRMSSDQLCARTQLIDELFQN